MDRELPNVQMQLVKPFRNPRRQDLPSKPTWLPLPLHLMGLVALAKAERGGEVAGKKVDLLDVGDQGLVDGLLVSRPTAGNLLLL